MSATTSSSKPEVHFSPSETPEAYVDPYPLYARMREIDPVHWNEAEGVWYVTRYDDVREVIRSPEKASSALRKAPEAKSPNYGRGASASGTGGRSSGQEEGFGTTWSMLLTDPPQHTQLRVLVQRAFSARTIRRMEEAIDRRTMDLIEGFQDRESIEFMSDFGRFLPTLTLTDLLGIRQERWDTLVECSEVSEEMLDPDCPDDRAKRYEELTLVFNEIIQEVIDDKRGAPGDDIVTELIQLEEAGEKLSEVELRSMIWTIISAGTKTTVDLLGNGMRALVERPEVSRRLRSEPELMRTAAEEVLRFDAPAHVLNRVAIDDFELRGKKIEKGQSIINLVASANRDPEQFENPDEFVPDRSPNRHLTFGNGAHFCLGAPLAKLEFTICASRMLERFPNLALADQPVRRKSVRHSGLAQLSLTL